jgi:hypothetical protein
MKTWLSVAPRAARRALCPCLAARAPRRARSARSHCAGLRNPVVDRLKQHTELCSSHAGAVALSANYLHASNIAIDLHRSQCTGANRKLKRGFLRLPCMPTSSKMELLGGHMKAIAASAAPLYDSLLDGYASGKGSGRGIGRRHVVDEESDLTIFVTREDMGNFAHHMGHPVGVFHILDFVKPASATIVMLDMRLMCWKRGATTCMADCFGPFKVDGTAQLRVAMPPKSLRRADAQQLRRRRSPRHVSVRTCAGCSVGCSHACGATGCAGPLVCGCGQHVGARRRASRVGEQRGDG